MDQILNDLVRAAGGDPETVVDPVAYLLSTIAERDSLRGSAGKGEQFIEPC